VTRLFVVPLVAGMLGLAGSLGATIYLHRSAASALDRVLEERLRGAGRTAAELFARTPPDVVALRSIMGANDLEGAYVLDASLDVLADATGPAGGPADLLRVDPRRVAEALQGRPTVAFSYAVGEHAIATGYFPITGRDGDRAVLALEAGQAFVGAREALARARWIGVALSVIGALALAAVALRWARSEAQRRRDGEKAARGDALARMGAMVAHEIRNPLSVIRGAVELVSARGGIALPPVDREALADVLGEVERLHRITDDFLDLAREPRIVAAPLDLAQIAGEALRGIASTHPRLEVSLQVPALTVRGDAVRLRQVLANLLLNAAQAGAHAVEVRGEVRDGTACIEIRDDGPGIDPAVRERLFEAFATGRRDGTGLGLAVSRRIVERHGGDLRYLAGSRPGAIFELRLPMAAG
jgi:signal transduction histidine kinase